MATPKNQISKTEQNKSRQSNIAKQILIFSIFFWGGVRPPSCVIHVLKGSLVNYLFPQHVNKSVTPFDTIHTDLWGPTPSISVDGYRYYTIFVDEYTKYCWIFPLVNKSDLFSTFVGFYSFVSTQFASTIKTLQTDEG